MKVYEEVSLDAKEFSDGALEKFKMVFKKLGYYIGDADIDYYGESQSDMYFLYITKRKMTKKELKEAFHSYNA